MFGATGSPRDRRGQNPGVDPVSFGADEALAVAELGLSNGLHRSVANRAYYSMFYGVLALLASRQAETSEHSGALSPIRSVVRQARAAAQGVFAVAA